MAIHASKLRYAPQRGVSCTPASIFYANAVLSRSTPAVCSDRAMNAIMAYAWAVYVQIRKSVVARFLQQHEVLEFVKMPRDISFREMYAGWNREFVNDVKGCIHFQDLLKLLSPNTAVVMTAGDHTTALVEECGTAFFFDPLVAEVSAVNSIDDLLRRLKASHANMDVMTLSVLTYEAPTAPLTRQSCG